MYGGGDLYGIFVINSQRVSFQKNYGERDTIIVDMDLMQKELKSLVMN